jgi:hypothetical protein
LCGFSLALAMFDHPRPVASLDRAIEKSGEILIVDVGRGDDA